MLYYICSTDSSESDDQQKHSESQIHSSSPAPGMSHPGIPGPIQYVAPPQIGAGHALVLSWNLNFFSIFFLVICWVPYM